MAPLVFASMVAPHHFGGSAGREGAAVQIGGAISEQFCIWFNLAAIDTGHFCMAAILELLSRVLAHAQRWKTITATIAGGHALIDLRCVAAQQREPDQSQMVRNDAYERTH